MSLIKVNGVQIGQSLTATDNFVWYQPDTPDGTIRLANGNSGAATDVLTINSTGNAVFTGSVVASGTSTSAADLKLYEDTDNGTNYVALKAPASIASNVTWTLPSADGTNGQALITNGSGTLSFTSINVEVTASSTNTLTNKTISGASNTLTVDGTNGVGYINIPYVADKTTSYTLTTADKGKVIGVGTGGSITVPDATFASGDSVVIFNNTSGNITITCSITTAYISGTNTDKSSVTLSTRGVANVLFVNSTTCVIAGSVL